MEGFGFTAASKIKEGAHWANWADWSGVRGPFLVCCGKNGTAVRVDVPEQSEPKFGWQQKTTRRVFFCDCGKFLPSVDESVSPRVQPHRSGTDHSREKNFERVQHHTLEQIVHVPIPQIQQLKMEGVKDIPQESLPQQTVGATRERNACSGIRHVPS